MLNGVCPDGSSVRSEIRVTATAASLVRADCADVPTVALDLKKLGLYPHNPVNLTYGGRVFDDKQETRSTAYFCRSFYKMKFAEGDHRIIGDFILRDASSGQLKFGFYNWNFDLKREFTSPDLQLVSHAENIPDGDSGQPRLHTVFEGDFQLEGRTYHLRAPLRMNNMEGLVELRIPAQAAPAGTVSIYDPPYLSFRMKCVTQ